MFNKGFKKLSIFLFLFIFIMQSTIVHATITDNQIVDKTKVWTIKFTQEVVLDEASKQSITVKDSKGSIVTCALSLGQDNKSVVVNPPTGGYIAGEKYVLNISNALQCKSGEKIKSAKIMNFTIKNEATSSTGITFPDKNLEVVIRDEIKKPTGDILKSDVEKIKELTASKKNITNLSGIENLTNLTSLDLSYNQISNIESLKGLTSLTVLYLSVNQISNIEALKELTSLKWLTLESNQISNIESLKGLTNLTLLYLSTNQISNIESLEGLTKLTSLALNINQISNIDSLKGLTSLTKLSLDKNQISNIESLKGLTSLTSLYLQMNQISNIDSLKGLTSLTVLCLNDNEISNIDSLKGMTGLTWLDLTTNQISNIDSLRGLTNLKTVKVLDCMDDLNRCFQVYDKADEIIKSIIKPGMSELEKEKAVHDYIVLNTRYDSSHFYDGTIPMITVTPYGILIEGAGVCGGYAAATKLLLNKAGIYCIELNALPMMNHGWDIVRIDGKYYHLDTTWDDPVPDRPGVVIYDYFNLTDSEISKDHKWDTSKYPVCNTISNHEKK